MTDVDICHLNLAKNYRGGERQTEILVRELDRRGYSQRLVIKRGTALRERCADIAGLDIREVASNPLAAALAARGSRILHAHEGRTAYSGLVANLLFGTPYVITRRVVSTTRDRAMRRIAYRRAAHIVGVSRAAIQSLNLAPDSGEVSVIPDAHSGFDSDPIVVAEIRARYPGKTLIGNVAALVHSHKGQSTIIDVARRVADKHPDWHFLLCGDGADEQRYRDEIGDLQNIELTGWVDNVGDYLASFDLFVYPSLHEALGSTLLDAMHFGVPIVASNVGGIPDVVEEGENGRLMAPDDPPALIEAIERLLDNPQELREIQARNLEKAKSFDIEHMATSYQAIYKAL